MLAGVIGARDQGVIQDVGGGATTTLGDGWASTTRARAVRDAWQGFAYIGGASIM